MRGLLDPPLNLSQFQLHILTRASVGYLWAARAIGRVPKWRPNWEFSSLHCVPKCVFDSPGLWPSVRVPRVTECPWQSSVSLCRVSLLIPSVPGNHRCPCAECPYP